MRTLLWLGLTLIGLISVQLLGLHWHQSNRAYLDIGFWGDQEFFGPNSFYAQEGEEFGLTYRWTRAHNTLLIRGFAPVRNPWLILDVGGLPASAPAPRTLRLTADQAGILDVPIQAEARRYHLLLPADALVDSALDLTLESETSRAAPDPRDVGLRLDGLALAWPDRAWVLPAWQTLLSEWVTVVVAVVIGMRLQLPRLVLACLAVALIAMLGWTATHYLLVAASWHLRVMAWSLILLALAWRALPLLQQALPGAELRPILVIAVLAIIIRLLGVSYPPFGSQDLYIHHGRLLNVHLGSLYLFDRPTEFARESTLVPPAFYMLALPFKLITLKSGVVLHTFYAIFDGLNALFVALLAVRLGTSTRAAAIAGMLIALLPIQFTAIWWGFGPQIAGQCLLVAIAALVVGEPQRSRTAWFIVGLLVCFVQLTHPGVALLGCTWLAGYTLLLWWFRAQQPELWKRWAAALAAGAFVSLLLLYGESLWLYLNGFAEAGSAAATYDNRARLIELAKGIRSSVRPLNVLAALGLLALVYVTRGPRRWLVVAWLGSSGLFLLIDVLLGLQVRYGYFTIPLVCVGVGLLLDRLVTRTRWAWIAVAGVVALTAYYGLSLWYEGIVEAVKPAMSALTH